MEAEEDSLSSLVRKNKRLRRRLLSSGWNKQESTHFILYQFLKLPQPQWDKPGTSVTFYQIKDKYKAESSRAELILSLQQLVPDLHQTNVLDYLHTIFQFSAINYGFELFESSSDSGENPAIFKKAPKGQRPLRNRPVYRQASPSSRKKVRVELQNCGDVVKEDAKHEELRLVRRRKVKPLNEWQQWQKKPKKEEFDD